MVVLTLSDLTNLAYRICLATARRIAQTPPLDSPVDTGLTLAARALARHVASIKPMITRRLILRILVVSAVAILLAMAAIYVLASWRPGYFRPAYLTQREKEIATQNFNAKIAELTNQVQAREPYALRMTQDEANGYLASTDEIALFLHPGRQRGDIQQLMDRVGLAEPCVRFANDVVTLMIRSSEYGKIFSADLSFSFDEAGDVRIHLKRARIGLLPIPKFVIR